MNNEKLKVYLEKGCNNESILMDINYKAESMFYSKQHYGFTDMMYKLNDLSRERMYILNNYKSDCCIKSDEKESKESLELEIESLTEYIKYYKEALEDCKKYYNEFASECLSMKDHVCYSICIDVLKLCVKSCKYIYELEDMISEYGTSDLALELINYKIKDKNTNDILPK